MGYGKDRDTYFHSLFRDYYPALTVFAVKYVGFQYTAEDIVQDVFLKLWESNDRLDSIHNISAYLYQMVRFRCLNHLRSARHLQPVDGEEHLIHSPDSDEFLVEDSIRILLKAVSELPPACREVFTLSLQGFRAKETAAMLGIAEETVKKQKQIARRILRGKLS
ncbi:RNA polymerase sigma-70 factor [Alistipes sp. OttesenSCG-928-B03]|nr:RNA polymerase sigma-70 factor [Alistipes sp. OttesenSCG-928-B03]